MTLEFTSSHLCSQGSHSFLLLTKRREDLGTGQKVWGGGGRAGAERGWVMRF